MSPVRKAAYDLQCQDLLLHIIRKNNKNMYLRIREPDGHIEITAPLNMKDADICRFAMERRGWILEHQQKVRSRSLKKETSPIDPPFVEREKKLALKRQLESLLARWEPVMGVRSNGFTIKKMKTRWGSCNVKTHHLNFNLALADLPERYVEYVVVHELTHLYEPSHNARFWAIMEHFLPGAIDIRKEMRQAGRS